MSKKLGEKIQSSNDCGKESGQLRKSKRKRVSVLGESNGNSDKSTIFDESRTEVGGGVSKRKRRRNDPNSKTKVNGGSQRHGTGVSGRRLGRGSSGTLRRGIRGGNRQRRHHLSKQSDDDSSCPPLDDAESYVSENEDEDEPMTIPKFLEISGKFKDDTQWDDFPDLDDPKSLETFAGVKAYVNQQLNSEKYETFVEIRDNIVTPIRYAIAKFIVFLDGRLVPNLGKLVDHRCGTLLHYSPTSDFDKKYARNRKDILDLCYPENDCIRLATNTMFASSTKQYREAHQGGERDEQAVCEIGKQCRARVLPLDLRLIACAKGLEDDIFEYLCDRAGVSEVDMNDLVRMMIDANAKAMSAGAKEMDKKDDYKSPVIACGVLAGKLLEMLHNTGKLQHAKVVSAKALHLKKDPKFVPESIYNDEKSNKTTRYTGGNDDATSSINSTAGSTNNDAMQELQFCEVLPCSRMTPPFAAIAVIALRVALTVQALLPERSFSA